MSKNDIKKAVDGTLFRRLYFFIRPYQKYVFFAVVLTLAASYLGTIRPKLIQIAVDDHIAYNDTGIQTVILYAHRQNFL